MLPGYLFPIGGPCAPSSSPSPTTARPTPGGSSRSISRRCSRRLKTALEKVTGEPIRVLASGRTDAGVHALGQVVGFSTGSSLPPDVLRRAINANLPEDIAVLDVAEAPEGFHPISHVRRKRYRYVIYDGPVRDVFRAIMPGTTPAAGSTPRRCTAPRPRLLGTHDFRSFETAGAPRPTSVRTVFDIFVRRGRAGQGGAERDWGSGVGD